MDSYPGIAKNSKVPPKRSFGCCKLAHRDRTAMGDILDHDGRPPEQQSFFRVPQQFQEVSRGRGGVGTGKDTCAQGKRYIGIKSSQEKESIL